MATEELLIDGGIAKIDLSGTWSGASTDVDDDPNSPDGNSVDSDSDGKNDEVEFGVLNPTVIDVAGGDVVTSISVVVRVKIDVGGNNRAGMNLVKGGTPLTIENSDILSTSFVNYTVNETSWDGAWTDAELDALKVRLLCVQSGMPTAVAWQIDAIKIIITYTPGAGGPVASGTPVMPIIIIDGVADTAYDGFGAFELPQITTVGAALHPSIADGQVILPSIETTGVADTAYEGIGAFALPIIETDGFASSIPEASGQPIMPSITINGDAGVAYTGDGAFSLSIVEISGDANTVYDAVSAFTLPIIEISGDALASAVGEASGQPILPIITIIGVANATVIASGTPVLPGIIIGGNADGGEIAVSKFVKTFTSEFTTEFTIE